MRGVSLLSPNVARARGARRRSSTRRLRQRWRWVPLPVRLKVAQLRSRIGHRRALVRIVGIIIALVVVLGRLAGPGSSEERANEVPVPAEHSIMSIGIDERVPPVWPGDQIDLYLSVDGFAGTDRVVTTPAEPSVVLVVTDAALTVAVPDDQVVEVATALSVGSVLVVRR